MSKIKNKLILFIISVIILSQFTSAINIEEPSSYSWFRMYLTLSTNLSLDPTKDDAKVDAIISELKIYPKNTELQSVSNLNIISNPTAATSTNNAITYEWEKPESKILNLGFTSEVVSENKITPIQTKLEFPSTSADPQAVSYLEATEHIDINENIRNKANELAAGEDDVYVVVFKIAEYVRTNVNYNLTTLTENVVQKSSWVYENKQGVCDEITSLFISMLRSIKIPAKFVEGVAYTNTLGTWGNHGWAEVYLHGYGWVPFDVTYGQYGFVDATHIRLGESSDSSMPSLTITGRTYNTEINTQELVLNTELLARGEKLPKLELIKIEPLTNQVGPGSYVPIKVELENLQSYYVPVQLRITKAPELTESNIKTVLLKPLQKKTVFWIVKIPNDLENNYIYSTLIEVIDSFGLVASEKINYADEYDTFTQEQANTLLAKNSEKESLIYSEKLSLNCKPGKNYYFDYEKAELTCIVLNTGNVVLNDLQVCLNQDCKTFGLTIADSKNLVFTDLSSNEEIKITAKNNVIDVASFVTIKQLNDPNLKISNLNFPDLILYKQPTNLTFLLSVDTPVKNIIFKLNGEEFFKLDNFVKQENRIFIFTGKKLYGPTYNNLSITYEDENGHSYQTSKSFLVNVKKVPFYARILYWLGF
ncbi:MAG: transglutaminase-like domain-containing protein [Candidatus Nanoarchaeia archaeon]|nr:transglutaminase-like domain-containing protein [Candidatus Nanoarchaeia archaeon]MDD5587997.1 transglutaminase-like domain-containing protein [Candidatus Nanoarchaeia archaeon]